MRPRNSAVLVCAIAHSCAAVHAAPSRTEIQINLCSEPARIAQSLQLNPAGRPTTVWLFDTPSLELHRQGLRLRLRESAKSTELTLKVGGQNCTRVAAASLGPHGKCETDLHGEVADDVVSLNATPTAASRRALLATDAARGAPLAAALTAALREAQRQWLASHRPAGSAAVPTDVVRLGPSTVQAYRSAREAFAVEVWTLPSGRQFVELSQKVPRDSATARRTDLLERLAARNVDVCADQASQARTRLELLVQ